MAERGIDILRAIRVASRWGRMMPGAMMSPRPMVRALKIGVWLVWLAAAASGQTPQSGPEMSTHDEPATFQTHVNLVMVPVVVRDREGRAVSGLTKDDFRLFDKGKPQEISRFSVEGLSMRNGGKAGTTAVEAPEAAIPAAAMPERFIGYLFDDVHLEAGDLMRVREAASRHMGSELGPRDRAAVFTTSGQGAVDFTDDLGKLHDALGTLRPRPIARSTIQECPDISYYMADTIINRNDPTALQAAVAETIVCQNLQGAGAIQQAEMIVQAASRQVLGTGDHETRVSLGVLKDVVRRMSALPGQRVLVLASGGFLTLPEHRPDETEILDRAIRGNIIINSLNARGLYVDAEFDASRRTVNQAAQLVKNALDRQAVTAQEAVLAELASGTGGTYFQNNNDLGEGYRRLATTPEIYYLLGFQPQNLKLDGSFHAVKVTLAQAAVGATVEARRGYYAPRHLENAEETARRETEEALFSREELHDFPVELQTQFFKGAADSATVAVLAHLDLRRLRFHKVDGRNVDSVTVISGLFDRNGNYVTGVSKRIDFKLRDETLAHRLDSGITVRTSLQVKPGTYAVRLVVRDAGGEVVSATNGAVEIP
jgi:VWFA-related protein